MGAKKRVCLRLGIWRVSPWERALRTGDMRLGLAIVADAGQKKAQERLTTSCCTGTFASSAERVLVDKCHLGKID